MTCLAQFPSCVQSVLAKEAIPTNTIECVSNTLLGKGESSPPSTEPGCQGTGGASGGSGGAPSGGAGGTPAGVSGGTSSGGTSLWCACKLNCDNEYAGMPVLIKACKAQCDADNKCRKGVLGSSSGFYIQ